MRRDFVGASLAIAIVGLAALAPVALLGGGSPRDDTYHAWAEDTVFTISEVRPGVFFATGRQGQVVGANSVFIVTDGPAGRYQPGERDPGVRCGDGPGQLAYIGG